MSENRRLLGDRVIDLGTSSQLLKVVLTEANVTVTP